MYIYIRLWQDDYSICISTFGYLHFLSYPDGFLNNIIFVSCPTEAFIYSNLFQPLYKLTSELNPRQRPKIQGSMPG
jgi:hypothetical protein